jgi:hypothetical protein
MALAVPIRSTRRARSELGWEPRRTADEAMRELLDGIREGAGADTPALAPGGDGPARSGEILTGVGARNP